MPTETRATIRVGVGGWTYEPWRGTFYPAGLAQRRELEYASRRLTSIEINGTYYGTQRAESFARWREETPEGFVFSLKGPRFTTNRRVLAEAGSSIERFLASGVMELKEKLGPINWQFLPTKRYDAADFEAFLKLLPSHVEGRSVRHVVEVRHDSFLVPDFIALLRAYGVAVAFADSDAYPAIPDITASFAYLRLQRSAREAETGYSREALDAWAGRARVFSDGGIPNDLESIGAPEQGDRPRPRDVFIYLINGFKPKAPAAAMALIERLRPAEA